VGHNCNLAIEFNGLVSKRVSRQIGPFYFSETTAFFSPFSFYKSAFFLPEFFQLVV
jgi:hypothetical protein